MQNRTNEEINANNINIIETLNNDVIIRFNGFSRLGALGLTTSKKKLENYLCRAI